jgi:calcineurin-like phosphoesterase family protein
MIFFTADWHLWHDNIIELCSRPFNKLKHMHNTLIKNHNDVVSKDDHVYIIGDLYWGRNPHNLINIINKFNGKKHLILGNHDLLKPFEYEETGIVQVATWLEVEEFILVHDPAKSIVYPGRRFLCGHVHDLFVRQKNVVNVGVDVWNFHPISIDTVRKALSTLEEFGV